MVGRQAGAEADGRGVAVEVGKEDALDEILEDADQAAEPPPPSSTEPENDSEMSQSLDHEAWVRRFAHAF